MRKITISCAQIGNYPEFCELQKRFSYLGTPTLRDKVTDMETFFKYVQNESLFFVFDERNQLIGYAFVNAFDDGICYIHEIFIDPDHQRNGYGKRLVQHIKDIARTDGLRKLQVFSVSTETDRFWMWSCGFRPDKEEKEYLSCEIN